LPIAAPSPLDAAHRLEGFRCNEPELAHWLVRRALRNQRDGASRCFVVCDGQRNVLGYYALAAGSVSHAYAAGSVRRNMPDPVPVVVLGRLAVHADHTGQGIGSGLLKDAVLRSLRLSGELGVRALLCHAMSPQAKAFYLAHGFIESPIDAMTVMLSLGRLRADAP